MHLQRWKERCQSSEWPHAGAQARLEGVNKPELLPKDFTTVIDVAGFLTPGEVRGRWRKSLPARAQGLITSCTAQAACQDRHCIYALTVPLTAPMPQESRLKKEVESLERDTGVKLRVLAQNYPNTPGLAVKDYWNVDDDTVVFVADPSLVRNLHLSAGFGLWCYAMCDQCLLKWPCIAVVQGSVALQIE